MDTEKNYNGFTVNNEKREIITQTISLCIWFAFILFLSGNWFWIEGWIFALWFIVLSLSRTVYLYRKDPELLKERSRKPGTGNQKGWDKTLMRLVSVMLIAWFLIMPLDAERFMWTVNFPILLKVVGGILLVISFFFSYRAYTDNTFLSPLVRIQSERKQQVVSTGVYGFVRHPLYLGDVLFFIGTPLLLGSKYGLILGVIMLFIMALRIIGEEKMLVENLEGYTDYQNKVKSRLIPFLW
ncbi:methyltransferase family protein [Methanobacterium sp.]|uniref:methyltransferase family protein n=1 Tax=Methanobacterium sp. TaxID=2164 RepID=UPI003C752669